MKNGTAKTRKGNREIISVSIPLEVYDKMQELCEQHNLNRSSMITSAITSYLKDIGKKVGER